MNNHENDFISGYFLESHQWEESKTEKNTWTREHAKVFYSGTQWYYNGKKIEDSIKKNPQLKIPQISIPDYFLNDRDYFERMMENK